MDSNDKIVKGHWGICGMNCNNETVENIVDERIIAPSISKINKGSYFFHIFPAFNHRIIPRQPKLQGMIIN